MPDAQGNFLGDQATVLPSNTEAMLHFSTQFAQMEKTRQAQLQKQQSDEQDRRDAITKIVGDSTLPADYASGTEHDPIINKGLAAIRDNGYKLNRANASNMTVREYLSQATGQLKSDSEKAKRMHSGIVQSAADALKKYPDLDVAAYAQLMGHAAFQKRDAQGNIVDKPSNELDENQNYGEQVMRDHPELLFPDRMAGTMRTVNDEAIQDVGQPSGVDQNGHYTSIGYKAKIPTDIMEAKTGPDGKPVFSVKSTDYKTPDGNTYINPNTRQPVTVVSDDVYNKYKGIKSIMLPIEGQVRKDLENTPVATDKPYVPGEPQEKVSVSPDSEYANMLRRKYMYENLDAATKGKYQPVMDDVAQREFENRRQLGQDNRADLRSKQQTERLAMAIESKNNTNNSTLTRDHFQPMIDAEAKQPGFEHRVDLMPNTTQQVLIDAAQKTVAAKDEKLTNKDLFFTVDPTNQQVSITRRKVDDNGVKTDVNAGSISYAEANINKHGATTKAEKQTILQKAGTAIKNFVTPSKKVKGTSEKLY